MKKVKNQAAVLYAPHDIRIEERPVPTPGMREVLIEIKAVGVCGSGYYPLHEAEKALQATRSDPANIKSVVVP